MLLYHRLGGLWRINEFELNKNECHVVFVYLNIINTNVMSNVQAWGHFIEIDATNGCLLILFTTLMVSVAV